MTTHNSIKSIDVTPSLLLLTFIWTKINFFDSLDTVGSGIILFSYCPGRMSNNEQRTINIILIVSNIISLNYFRNPYILPTDKNRLNVHSNSNLFFKIYVRDFDYFHLDCFRDSGCMMISLYCSAENLKCIYVL